MYSTLAFASAFLDWTKTLGSSQRLLLISVPLVCSFAELALVSLL